MSSVYIIGASGFAREITNYIEDEGKIRVEGYFDVDHNKADRFSPFLGLEDDFEFKSGDAVLISISNCLIRERAHEKLKKRGLEFPSLIHTNTYVSPEADIGEGVIVCPYVTITSNARIGINFHANIYSYVAHDCIIGDNVTFAPGVKCSGNVIIEDSVYVGTGAIILPGKPDKPLVVGAGSVIAAGAVVTKSVPAGKVVFGNPAIEFTPENIRRRS